MELLVRGAWPSRGLPFMYGHQRGLVETLPGSGYFGKNTSGVHENLHLYLCYLASAFTFKYLSFNLYISS
jgi:hypothetical protein